MNVLLATDSLPAKNEKCSLFKASDGVDAGIHLSITPRDWSDHSALLDVLAEFFLRWTRIA